MEKISKEILLYIFNFLDLKDLVICSSVNHLWYDITNSNTLWRKFCYGNKYLTDYEDKEDDMIHKTLKPMCYWKFYFINDKIITENWLKKKFKTKSLIKLNPIGKLCDIVNYKMANYDGKTLVICLNTSVKVYRKIEGIFEEVQTISISKGILLLLTSIFTNTLYISLNCGKIVIVYKLNNDLYKELVMFYKNVDSLILQFSTIKLSKFEDKITKSFFSGCVCNINSLLLGEFLYILIEKKLYVWNLMDMICCKDIEVVRFLIAQNKNNNIFISFDHNNIIGFDVNSKTYLTLKTDWFIIKIETNEKFLLALVKESVSLSDETVNGKIIVWNKFNGEKLYETFLNCVEMLECSFLHPKLDILLNITEDNDIWAINLKEMELLWKRPIERYQNPFNDNLRSIGFRNLAADKFLISTVDLSKNYYLIDVITGETLYCFDRDEIIYVSYDLLLLTDPFKKNIFIRQYS